MSHLLLIKQPEVSKTFDQKWNSPYHCSLAISVAVCLLPGVIRHKGCLVVMLRVYVTDSVCVDKSLTNTERRFWLPAQVQPLVYQQPQQIRERREDQRRSAADAPGGLWIWDRQQSPWTLRGGKRRRKASRRSGRGKQARWEKQACGKNTDR